MIDIIAGAGIGVVFAIGFMFILIPFLLAGINSKLRRLIEIFEEDE